MSLNLPVRVSGRALDHLVRSIVPADAPRDARVELVIIIEDTDLNVRQLAAFLQAIDNIYGRLTTGDLASYARKPSAQLRLAEVRKGSLQLSFQDFVNAAEVLAIILLFLRLISSTYERFQRGRLHRAEAELKREEAALIRERRKLLREEAKVDELLRTLEARQRNEIVRLLEALYRRERKLVPRMTWFMNRVKDITLRLRD